MEVQISGVGANSNVETQIDPTFQSQRTSLRPTEYAPIGAVVGGHYGVTALTGTMAAGIAAASQVFQIRWADPTKLFILLSLSAVAQTGTAFTTLWGADLELIVGHGSSANGSGGGTVTPTGVSQKRRLSMAPSGFVTAGEIRIATTAALTAATGQTLEPAGIGYYGGAPFLTNTREAQGYLFEQRDAGDHPLILAAGDTLVVRTPNPGATGTWHAGFVMEWLEAVSY